MQPIRASVIVPLDVSAAFSLYAEHFGSWWPPEYTWAQDTLQQIGLEPKRGGRCYEIGPHDFHSDWGRVLAWEAPDRLVLSWQISPRREPEPDPAKASEVEVRFDSADGRSTRVSVEHRGLERHGQGAAEYREALASSRGWPWILDCYARAAARSATLGDAGQA